MTVDPPMGDMHFSLYARFLCPQTMHGGPLRTKLGDGVQETKVQKLGEYLLTAQWKETKDGSVRTAAVFHS